MTVWILYLLKYTLFAANTKLLIVGAYIPTHMQVQLYKDFANCLEEIRVNYSKNEIIVCGDFNLPYIQWLLDTSDYTVQRYVNPNIVEAADLLQ